MAPLRAAPSGTHPANHTSKLCKLTNARAGRPEVLGIKAGTLNQQIVRLFDRYLEIQQLVMVIVGSRVECVARVVLNRVEWSAVVE